MPIRKERDALIRVAMAGICNTDKEIVRGYKKGFKGILGHEFVGVVEDAPDKNLIGKRVVGAINIGCGQCDFCSNGFPNHCRNRRVLGMIQKDGAFAEYLTLPQENLYIVPDGVCNEEAVFAEPLAAAMEITQKYHIKPTDKVAVIGDGKLGQLIGRILALTGCDLTVIGRHREKLELISNLAGVALTSEANYENYFDVIIECTGNEQGFISAQRMVKATGTIVLKSTFNGTANLDPTHWVVNEINIVGTRCGPMDAALRLLEKKLVSVKPLISGFYRLEDYSEAFDKKDALKIIFNLSGE